MQINKEMMYVSTTIIKYIILILIALLIGWNIRISTDDCKNGICPVPKEYNERGDNDGKNNK